MTYQLGVDLGTTFTAAAVHRDGRSHIFSLGSNAASIPSVVLLREDETELTGEAAVRRSFTEPERVAREFKRRLGDTTPIIVGGAPYSAEQLMARLLKATLDEVVKREGGPPSRIAVTHPANWGPYKIDLLQQAIRLSGMAADDVVLLTEPEAAAFSYASQQRVELGEIVAVYDLGGGTFDAAVLRRTEDGFEIIGRPEGIERLGGIDFDAAVFAYVGRALDGKLQELDPEDSSVVSGVARLRDDCVDAKVALSSDTDVSIPVLLAGLQTEVRLTRSEFEALIRPSLADSIGAMKRALDSADVSAADVSKVLLVGGSSRIPLISQMVSSELGRPVAVDADPKHAVALGAAEFAAGTTSATTGATTSAPAGSTGVGSGGDRRDTVPEPVTTPTIVAPVTAVAPTTAMPTASMPTAPAAPEPPSKERDGDSSKLPLLIGVILAILLVGGGAIFALTRGSDGDTASEPAPAETPVSSETPVSTDAPAASVAPVPTEPPETVPPTTDAPVETTTPTTTLPPRADEEISAEVAARINAIAPRLASSVSSGVAVIGGQIDAATENAVVDAASAVEGVVRVDNQLVVVADDEYCNEMIRANDRWACIESVVFDGTNVRATYFDGGTVWDIGSEHLHFFADSTDPQTAGTNGAGVSTGGGLWIVWDTSEEFFAAAADLGGRPERLCVRVALPDHSLESLGSGNCFVVTDL